MSIKVGTLCLIVRTRRAHQLRGRSCTVIEGLAVRRIRHVGDRACYRIDILDWEGRGYLCQPDQLIPLSDPDFRESEDKREVIKA